MDLETLPWYVIAAAALTAILGVGRGSRIVTYDTYPPAVWWRMTWARITNDGPWEKLFSCPWCFTPWLMAVCIGWFFLGGLILWVWIAWWVFWGWLGLAYLSSIVIAYDEPE